MSKSLLVAPSHLQRGAEGLNAHSAMMMVQAPAQQLDFTIYLAGRSVPA